MYFDLNVTWNMKSAHLLLNEATDLGYHGLAFTSTIDPVQSNSFKSPVISEQIQVKQDINLTRKQSLEVKSSLSPLCLNFPLQPGHIVQLKRLHVNIASTNDFSTFAAYARTCTQKEPTGQSIFDLISIGVHDERVWQLALQQPYADIVVLDFYASRLPFPLKRNQILFAAKQNIYFEVCLDKALLDPSQCKNLFRNLPYLLRYLPLDRLLLTSGATTPMQMRAPRDLGPLLQMLGVPSAAEAASIMSTNALNVISRASARRTAGPGYPGGEVEDVEME